MKVYQHLSEFNVDTPVVTIGSFDGVHRGHLKIIDRLKSVAQEKKGESVVITFSPHPRLVLAPSQTGLQLLNTTAERIQLLEKAGVEHLILYPFTKEFAEMSHSDFIRNILVGQLKMKSLIIGYDNKFGKNREGNFQSFKDLSSECGFSLEQLEALSVDGLNVSSTIIRKALEKGELEEANNYLGYLFKLQGTVVKGKQLGRKIQFPTANLKIDDTLKIIPGDGVFAVWVTVGRMRYRGMLNIGVNPTVSTESVSGIEVHILDFSHNIYGQNITVEFVAKLRDEKKFPSIEKLKEQLEKDKAAVGKLLDVS